jgi:hypothetical protein
VGDTKEARLMSENTMGATEAVATSPFTDAERRVFTYFNGTTDVFGDPIPCRRKLVIATGGKLTELLAAFYGDGTEGSATAAEVLLPAVRTALALPNFDPVTGSGCTDADVEAALHALLNAGPREMPCEEGQRL